ncbi:MAG: hypothetical protein HZA32_18635 [Opitutae bacterium]|nr:hypothetical protein [Opitutae bacterium]
MINLLKSRLRPLLVPLLVLGLCLAAIFFLRSVGGQPRGQLLIQTEMNRQFDMFQAALAQANDVQIEMQRRMLQAEEIRAALTVQFERSQKELVETQRTLLSANQALLATQDALRRAQEDYERARDGGATVAKPEALPIAASEPEPITDEQRRDLEKLRQDNLRLAEAVAQSVGYFERVWFDYSAAGSALASVRAQLSMQKSAALESIQPPPPERAPDLGAPVAIGGVEQDRVPQISNRLLKMWIVERFDTRSNEMIALQQRLTKVNRAIQEVSGKLVERQKALATLQSELLERRPEK